MRLSYWPMIPAGDFDSVVPVFEYYLQMLPFAKARTREYFQHEGVFFTETKTVFGAFAMSDYGCTGPQKGSRPPGYPHQLEANGYTRMDYAGNAGGTEVSLMLLDHYYYSLDETILRRYFPVLLGGLCLNFSFLFGASHDRTVSSRTK